MHGQAGWDAEDLIFPLYFTIDIKTRRAAALGNLPRREAYTGQSYIGKSARDWRRKYYNVLDWLLILRKLLWKILVGREIFKANFPW